MLSGRNRRSPRAAIEPSTAHNSSTSDMPAKTKLLLTAVYHTTCRSSNYCYPCVGFWTHTTRLITCCSVNVRTSIIQHASTALTDGGLCFGIGSSSASAQVEMARRGSRSPRLCKYLRVMNNGPAPVPNPPVSATGPPSGAA